MNFIPDYKLEIIKEEDFETSIKEVEERLSECKNSGYFDSFDGKKMYYEYFSAEKAKASIVIVHGLSEFSKKFHEAAYYFLNQGYNVFIYDQRGHGLSFRMTEQIDLIHVDSFYDYAKDLDAFIENVVMPTNPGTLYIYSHSMGGAVTTLYLAKNHSRVKKALLSAPLFDPVVTHGVSDRVAKMGVFMAKLFCGGKKKFFGSKEFNPEVKYNGEADASKARFDYNMDLRRNNPCYQSTPMSLSWTYGSLTICSKLLNKKITEGIKTPMLILSAENDSVVKIEPQFEFASKCDMCEIVTIKNASHAMLAGDMEIMTDHLTRTLRFFED